MAENVDVGSVVLDIYAASREIVTSVGITFEAFLESIRYVFLIKSVDKGDDVQLRSRWDANGTEPLQGTCLAPRSSRIVNHVHFVEHVGRGGSSRFTFSPVAFTALSNVFDGLLSLKDGSNKQG